MKPLSRRACLRGLGVSLALPWLEIMAPRRARAAPAPLRFVVVYSPNGFLMNKWTPTATGIGWATPPLLKALEPFRGDWSVISGLGNYTASIANVDGGSHTRACGSLLTQSPIAYSSGNGIRAGVSVDQVIAESLKTVTRFPSLQVGSRAGSLSGDCEDGYSCAYQNNISWAGSTTPLPKQVNPRDIFERLFTTGAPPAPGGAAPVDNRAKLDRSVLDLVSARAQSLRLRLGKTDRGKLEEYLTAIREVEQRIALETSPPAATPPACAPGVPPPSNAMTELPFAQHLDLISDLLALAFQCDATRVATYMFEHSFTDLRSMSFLPGVTGRHHAITHSDAADQEEKIDLFYVERFAYLLGKLKGIREGDRTLLDNAIVYFTSEFGDGHLHDHRKLPMVLAGKAGGKFKTGLHVNYPLAAGSTGIDGRGNRSDVQIGQLHLTAIRAFGIDRASFGQDAEGPLATKVLSEVLA